MSVLPIPRPASNQLAEQRESVLICNYDGLILGQFIPATTVERIDLSEPPLSREELNMRANRTSGRTLAEIMTDLEKRS